MARGGTGTGASDVPEYGTPESLLARPWSVTGAQDAPITADPESEAELASGADRRPTPGPAPAPAGRARVVSARTRAFSQDSTGVMVVAVLSTVLGMVPLGIPAVVMAGRAEPGERGRRRRAWSLGWSALALTAQACVVLAVT